MAIIRSTCAGIAAVFLAAGLCLFVGLPIVMHFVSKSAPSGQDIEVGWDVVSMAHHYGVNAMYPPLLVFALGFLWGFRYFSKSIARK